MTLPANAAREADHGQQAWPATRSLQHSARHRCGSAVAHPDTPLASTDTRRRLHGKRPSGFGSRATGTTSTGPLPARRALVALEALLGDQSGLSENLGLV